MYPEQITLASIERIDGLVTLAVLERMLEDAKSIVHEFMADGFSKEETMTYLWFCMSNDRMPNGAVHWEIVLDTVNHDDENFQAFLKEHGITSMKNPEQHTHMTESYIYRCTQKSSLMGMMWLFWDDDLSEDLHQVLG